MMLCEGCLQEFTPDHHNRRYCYVCVPKGLTRNRHAVALMKAKSAKARREKMDLGCEICGYNRCGSALEWHHPDEGKEANPSRLASSNWAKYKEETAKCILVCANCHREIHEREKET